MATYAPSARLLLALFDMVQAGENIELFSLSEVSGLNLYRTLSELDRLDRRGLVDRRRLRLTAAGLTVAVSLDRRDGVREARTVAAPMATVVRLSTSAVRKQAVRKQSEGSVDQVFGQDLVA